MNKFLSIFTTATAAGVNTRYWTAIISAMISVLGVLGLLDDDQQKALIDAVPSLLAAITALIMVIVPTYAAITKSHSNKAAEAAKVIDTRLPASLPVDVKASGHDAIRIQPTK